MRKIALLLTASSLLLAQGQLPRPIRSHLESVLMQASQRVPTLQLPPTFARTANLFRPDSFWVDTFGNGNWILRELTTHLYSPTGVLLRDSNYVWRAGWSIQAATQYYYYTQGAFAGDDSLQVFFECTPNCRPDERIQFSYTPLSPNAFRENILYEDWNGTGWDTTSRSTAWYRRVNGSLLIDSLKAEIYNSGSWSEFIKSYYFYTQQGLLDSVYREAFGGLFMGYGKFYYDAQGRVSLVRDTSTAGGVPNAASLTYYFYDEASTQPSRDSTVARYYTSTPPSVDIYRSAYTYDAQGNVLMIVYDTCGVGAGATCVPTIRERYHYLQFATAIAPAPSKQSLPSIGSVGSTLEIPAQIGRTYRLYDSAGRLLQQGSLSESSPTFITLPAQVGLYILQIDQQAHRLLVLP